MQELQGVNRFAQNQQVSGRQQHAEICHDMADVLSILQCRWYMVQRNHMIDDDEIQVFDQCLFQLRLLLDCWKQCEADKLALTEEPSANTLLLS
jgi:hypothetical protein